MAAWYKYAAAMGSALPDPVKDQAALAPVPQQAIENKPAPGQTGPKGMSPRTTYSRINVGSPPVMDAGGQAQKSGPNRGMEFLPAKVAAQRGFMTTMKERPLLQELVKAAMLGSTERLSVNLEAARQERVLQGVKTASAPSRSLTGHVSTELINKIANALGFIEQQLLKEADLMPGEGPNALQVMEATSSETNIDAGEGGQATAKNQPPQTPALQPEKSQQGNAGTGLQTNDEMMHGEQPIEPIKNASALYAKNLAHLQKVADGSPEGHHLRRALLGNDISSAIEARKGERGAAFGESYANSVKNRLGGLAAGGGVGSAIGAAAGAVLKGKKGLIRGAGLGALGGGGLGLTAGSIRGNHGAEASRIHAARSAHKEASAMGKLMAARDAVKNAPAKVKAVAGGAKKVLTGENWRGRTTISGSPLDKIKKKEIAKTVGAYTGIGAAGAGGVALAKGKKKESSVPLALIRKLAEDVINPAQILGSGSVNPAEPPPGVSASEEGVPSEPADVTNQKRLISSNQAAINFTKREAKADPKKDLAQVVTEPPLSSATDKVLDRVFDHTNEAGAKISSAGGLKKTAQQVGATRVLLSRLLKEASAQTKTTTGARAATMGQ